MRTEEIRAALEAATSYLTEHPDEAAYTDSAATARLEEGLRVRVKGPAGETLVTDMPASVGGSNSAPSPGWMFRAALAACEATLIAMRAAQEGLTLGRLEVLVDGRSDDRGILGIDPDVPAGPLDLRVEVRLDGDPERAREVVEWGHAHCPVADAAGRSVPVVLEPAAGTD